MDESGLGEGDVVGLDQVDSLARQGLDHSPVVQLTVININRSLIQLINITTVKQNCKTMS